MPDFTFVLAGKIGVGKTTIFRRIQVGHFVETAMSENEEIEHCLYKAKIKDNDFKVSGHTRESSAIYHCGESLHDANIKLSAIYICYTTQ